MSAKLMEYFNKTPRIGTLSTASKSGQVNTACFGSRRMIDENSVVMSVRNARTFSNLQENPNAVFMIVEPGRTPFVVAHWFFDYVFHLLRYYIRYRFRGQGREI
jgi:hypothetical protein